MIDENDIVYRLGFRIGFIDGFGWPLKRMFRRDKTLHADASAEILALRSKVLELELRIRFGKSA